MITTEHRQEAKEMSWAVGAPNGMALTGALTQGIDQSPLMDDLYRIVSLSLLFFDAIVKPFDRMIEEEEYDFFKV